MNQPEPLHTPPADCTPRRLRIVFRKGDAIKYISHLDLLRAWERVIRRAQLPLAYSQGFNPHPRITIAMPLAVGCIGENEVLDVLLWAGSESQQALEQSAALALEPVMPPGLSIGSVSEVPRQDPALATLFQEACYQIVLEGVDPDEVEQRVFELMRQEEVRVEFRRKSYNLRPLIGTLSLEAAPPTEPKTVVLEATLLRNERGRTGRPDVLLSALRLDPFVRRIVRSQMVFQQ